MHAQFPEFAKLAARERNKTVVATEKTTTVRKRKRKKTLQAKQRVRCAPQALRPRTATKHARLENNNVRVSPKGHANRRTTNTLWVNNNFKLKIIFKF